MKLLMILLLGAIANGLAAAGQEPPLLVDSAQPASSTSTAN
jgi:hypothetical protein